MKRFIVATIFAALSPAAAAQWALSLGGVSAHTKPGHNAANAGIGLHYRASETWAAGAGAYYNSNYRMSTYALATWTPIGSGAVRAGLVGGLVTGYRVPVMPVLAPALVIEYRSFAATVFVIPPLSANNAVGVVGVNFRYAF